MFYVVICNSVDVVGRFRVLVKSMFEKDLIEMGRERELRR